MRPFPPQAAVPHCAVLLQRLCKMHQPSTIYGCVCPSNMVPYGPLGECRVSADQTGSKLHAIEPLTKPAFPPRTAP